MGSTCRLQCVKLSFYDENKNKFDEKKAWKFIKSVYGTPFGFHGYFTATFDKPEHSTPEWWHIEWFSLLFVMLEKIMHKNIYPIYTSTLEKRLGGKTIAKNFEIIFKQKKNVGDILATPEKDEWVYNDGPSYVCSALVAGIYKSAGIFGNLKINAKEFTPKDVYELEIFDKTGKYIPEECKPYSKYGYC